MPAQLDDPATPSRYRESGARPFPTANTSVPSDIRPRQLELRDGTVASVFPFSSPTQLPTSLVSYVCDMLAAAIEDGNTYPMLEPLPLQTFAPYWFGVFGAVMLKGTIEVGESVLKVSMSKEADGDGKVESNWDGLCLGSFYTKPNYPGRSSHVCNAGFLVAEGTRGKGVGRNLGEVYLDWAPKLGYTYSVFNLVYETNVASCRIWDGLGFDRIGRVPHCGDLKGSPGTLIDSIVYGKDLRPSLSNDRRQDGAIKSEAIQDGTIATVV